MSPIVKYITIGVLYKFTLSISRIGEGEGGERETATTTQRKSGILPSMHKLPVTERILEITLRHANEFAARVAGTQRVYSK